MVRILLHVSALGIQGGIIFPLLCFPLDRSTTFLSDEEMHKHWKYFVFAGEGDAAVSYFDQAVVGCGLRMNVAAVRSALLGLKTQALAGRGRQFSRTLLEGLGVPANAAVMVSGTTLPVAIDQAVLRLNRVAAMALGGDGLESSPVSSTTKVDLCFIMDCTGSVRERLGFNGCTRRFIRMNALGSCATTFKGKTKRSRFCLMRSNLLP